MAPESARKTPEFVGLRGRSTDKTPGLEITVHELLEPVKELDQLTANKAIQEIEEGRGWLLGVKDEKDTALETHYSGCFAEMVLREVSA